MADKLKVEVHEKDVIIPENLKNDLTKFKWEIERKAKEVQQQKTLAEAQKLMDWAHVSVDYKDIALQIGDVVLKFETRKDLDDTIAAIETDLNKINAELQSAELDMRREKDQVIAESKDATNAVNPTNELFDKLQQIVDQNKEFDQSLQTFLTENDAQDIAKLLELYAKLKKTKISNEAGIASVLTAGTIAALEEQNAYLQKIVAWYEKEGATFDIKKFKEKNQKHISKDLSAFAKQFGVDLPANEKTDKIEKQSTEKTFEEMSAQEKVSKAQEAMNTLTSARMLQERNPYTGQMENIVTLTPNQISAVQTIYQLWWADFWYEAIGFKKNKTEKANDKLVEKAEKAMDRGNYKRAEKIMDKASDRFTSQRKLNQRINALSQNAANERNRSQYSQQVSREAMNLAKWPGYAGTTVDVIPYTPLFTNICQNINALAERGHVTLDVAWLWPVQVRSPERYKLAFGNAYNGVAGQYGIDGNYAFWWWRGVNWVEDKLTKYTGMNTEQAKWLTNGLLIGWWALLLFKSAKWLFTGKWKSDKKFADQVKDSFWLRAALVWWGLWWANKLSQMWTGQNLFDVMKWLYTGKMEFKDLWKWTYSKYGKNSPEYLSGVNQSYNQAFRNVPYGKLLPFMKEWQNGAAEIKDINGIIGQLMILESQEKDPNKKANLHSQVLFLQSLEKDPKGISILNEAMANLGITYKTMEDNKEKTVNEISDKMTERLKKYNDFLQEKWYQLKSDATAKLNDFLTTWKPTLEEIEKEWLFEKVTKKNANPLIEVAPDGTEIEVDPGKKEPALKDVDLTLAKELYIAKEQLAQDGIDMKLELKNGVLLVKSREMVTPMMYENGWWYVWGESSWHGNDRFGTRFEGAKEALWVAQLTNTLIHEFTGKFAVDTKEPFSADWQSLQYKALKDDVWYDKLWSWSGLRKDGLDSTTAKSKWWVTFADNMTWYAQYLNGIHNKNWYPIWNKDGEIPYSNRSAFIDRRLQHATKFPKRKDAEKMKDETTKTPDVIPVTNPNNTNNKAQEWGNPDNTNKNPDNTTPDKSKTPEQLLQDKIDTLVNMNDVKWIMEIFRWWSKGKDGWSKDNPSDQYEMPEWLLKARAINYMLYGEKWAGNKEFTYNYENKTKWIKKAVTYERQEGQKAPRRIKEEDGKR